MSIKSSKSSLSSRYRIAILATSTLCIFYLFCLPKPLFHEPISTVIEDKDGRFLGARIASDGQWRFPEIEQVPEKFEQAIITFEDKRFYSHPGFDIRAIGRAIRQNISAGKVISGASTLSMQVIRLSRKGKPRSVFEKIKELILATRLELRYSKKEILGFYTSYAPYGGNVVGLEAASWRYFGKKPQFLSWAEASMLAVLPNSPSLIHPGRNRDVLKSKRDRLLKKLQDEGIIESTDYELAIQEALPDKPIRLPMLAPHLLDRINASTKNEESVKSKIETTLLYELQRSCNQLALRKSKVLKHNGIHNLAIIVVDVKTKEVLSYVGNAPNTGKEHGEQVDIIQASRSTGSILKPFLYCKMIQNGELLPNAFVPDIPSYFNGYRPENFFQNYTGAIPADQALIRSLNIPFVRLLQEYGVERFHFDLNQLGLSTINQPAEHYGLTLILGGAEANLFELTSVYSSMAKRLGSFYERDSKYSSDDFGSVNFLTNKVSNSQLIEQDAYPDAGSIWLTFQALSNLGRPISQGQWKRFSSSRKIAWKTGTSIGYRDAWAIGATPEYVVGVWVGNADGEGRPGLVGVKAAAPLMFDVFNLLPSTSWFSPPYDAMEESVVCSESGLLAKKYCEPDTVWNSISSMVQRSCHYHQLVHLNEDENYQVNSSCYEVSKIKSKEWFVLPPIEEGYFKAHHPNYKSLPPFAPFCQNNLSEKNTMDIIYPDYLGNIKIPIELDGTKGKVIFKAVHTNDNETIHWHIDSEYLGSTIGFHSIQVQPKVGTHKLVLVDNSGNRLTKEFEIME